jgi:hypothetical protein
MKSEKENNSPKSIKRDKEKHESKHLSIKIEVIVNIGKIKEE